MRQLHNCEPQHLQLTFHQSNLSSTTHYTQNPQPTTHYPTTHSTHYALPTTQHPPSTLCNLLSILCHLTTVNLPLPPPSNTHQPLPTTHCTLTSVVYYRLTTTYHSYDQVPLTQSQINANKSNSVRMTVLPKKQVKTTVKTTGILPGPSMTLHH